MAFQHTILPSSTGQTSNRACLKRPSFLPEFLTKSSAPVFLSGKKLKTCLPSYTRRLIAKIFMPLNELSTLLRAEREKLRAQKFLLADGASLRVKRKKILTLFLHFSNI